MSRIAKAPITIGSGMDVKIEGQNVSVKGSKGTLSLNVHPNVEVIKEGSTLSVKPRGTTTDHWMHAGTVRALLANMVQGCSKGFEKKLTLIGVGYRAQIKGNVLDLSLGFSHPVEYKIPEGISIQCPSQTEIVVAGSDLQRVGQVAAEIRAYRPPEPYKGKGVRYADEFVLRKEAKKK